MYIFIFRFPSFFSIYLCLSLSTFSLFLIHLILHDFLFLFSGRNIYLYRERFCISVFSTSNLFMFGLSLLNVRSRNNINVNFLLYPVCKFFCWRCTRFWYISLFRTHFRCLLYVHHKNVQQQHTRRKIITRKIENPFILVLSFNAPL